MFWKEHGLRCLYLLLENTAATGSNTSVQGWCEEYIGAPFPQCPVKFNYNETPAIQARAGADIPRLDGRIIPLSFYVTYT